MKKCEEVLFCGKMCVTLLLDNIFCYGGREKNKYI